MDCFSVGGMMESALNSWQDAPWPEENIVHQNSQFVVFKDGFPVRKAIYYLYQQQENM